MWWKLLRTDLQESLSALGGEIALKAKVVADFADVAMS
jgi:hypothetical protein